MFYRIGKIFIVAVFVTFPIFVLAGPSVSWDSAEINGETLNGSIVVSGIESGVPPLSLFLFTDSDSNFNPFVSYALLGPASNNTFNFQIPYDGTMTHFLPILDNGSFNNQTTFNPFSAYSVGQVANPSQTTGDPGGTDESGDSGSTNESGDPGGTDEAGDPSVVTGYQITSTINNPLGVNFDITNFFEKLFKNFVKIALPILVLFTVWSGLQFVLAQGNEDKLKKAKENFLYVIIGAAVILGSWTIAKLLAGTVEQFEAFNSLMKLLV